MHLANNWNCWGSIYWGGSGRNIWGVWKFLMEHIIPRMWQIKERRDLPLLRHLKIHQWFILVIF